MNIADLFGSWFKSVPSKQRSHVLLGVAAVCWALWLSRNDVVFNRSKSNSCLQVIFRGSFWIRSWSILSKEEEKEILIEGSRRLELAALEILNRTGWNGLKKIKA